jgi:hypothetical protein
MFVIHGGCSVVSCRSELSSERTQNFNLWRLHTIDAVHADFELFTKRKAEGGSLLLIGFDPDSPMMFLND